ncbi:MAG: hypothetical protein ACR2JK_17355 [Geodermatophilaceae bacterium]
MSFEPLSHAQVPPAAPRRRHLGLKIAGGFLVVVGLVLGTGALVDNLGGSPEYQSAPPAAGAVAPDALDPAAFSTAMSAAARGSDPAAFLAFFAPALQVDAGRYFANLRALGVDGVLAAIQTTDLRELQAESFDGILQIGFHIPGIDGAEVTPMEPLTGMAVEPNRMPSTAYDVTVRRTDTSGVIEAWSPVGGPAPWDVQELVSVQGPGYVLATGVQNEALLGQYNDAAAQATDYTTALFEELLPDLPGSGLDNPGFLLFVEPDDELFSSYFVFRTIDRTHQRDHRIRRTAPFCRRGEFRCSRRHAPTARSRRVRERGSARVRARDVRLGHEQFLPAERHEGPRRRLDRRGRRGVDPDPLR